MCSICHSDNNIVISVNTCKLLVIIPNKNETRTALKFFFFFNFYVEMIVPYKNETRTALKKFFLNSYVEMIVNSLAYDMHTNFRITSNQRHIYNW